MKRYCPALSMIEVQQQWSIVTEAYRATIRPPQSLDTGVESVILWRFIYEYEDEHAVP